MSWLGLLFGGIVSADKALDGHRLTKERLEYERKYGKEDGFREWMLKDCNMGERCQKKLSWGMPLTSEEQAAWNKICEKNMRPEIKAIWEKKYGE